MRCRRGLAQETSLFGPCARQSNGGPIIWRSESRKGSSSPKNVASTCRVLLCLDTFLSTFHHGVTGARDAAEGWCPLVELRPQLLLPSDAGEAEFLLKPGFGILALIFE